MYCIICGSEEEVRQINMYPIGSEGCPTCHKCEIKVVEFIRDLISKEGIKRKNKYLSSKWFSETGEFIGHIPKRIVIECSARGDRSDNVVYWVKNTTFNVPEELARKYLKKWGAWEDLETCSYDTLKERVFWLACCEIKEEGKWFGLID